MWALAADSAARDATTASTHAGGVRRELRHFCFIHLTHIDELGEPVGYAETQDARTVAVMEDRYLGSGAR